MAAVRPWISTSIPIDCAGDGVGCELAPEVYQKLGLLEVLQANDAGLLTSTKFQNTTRDPEVGIRCYPELIRFNQQLYEKVQPFLENNWNGKRILILGGCCTILVGICGAFQKLKKEVGLVFIDGHWDCYDGKSSPNGELADMELSIILGMGPKALTELTGQSPIISQEKVFVVGPRDLEESLKNGAQDPRKIFPKLQTVTCKEIQQQKSEKVAQEILQWGRKFKDGFWVHLDIDVLSDEAFPAVDYHQPGGLTWKQLAELIQPLAKDPTFRGLNLTIYNPKLDGFPDYQQGLQAGKRAVRELGLALA